MGKFNKIELTFLFLIVFSLFDFYFVNAAPSSGYSPPCNTVYGGVKVCGLCYDCGAADSRCPGKFGKTCSPADTDCPVEICNGVDDNYNGIVDDIPPRSCGTDTGYCVAGTETCSAGSWVN